MLAIGDICTRVVLRMWNRCRVYSQKTYVGAGAVAVHTPRLWSVGLRQQLGLQIHQHPLDLLSSSVSLNSESRCVGVVVEGASLYCSSPLSSRLVRGNVSFSLSFLFPVSHSSFLSDCLPCDFCPNTRCRSNSST